MIDKEIGIVKELTKIFGIGPVRAQELYEKNGIESIDDLKRQPELLNEKQKIGLVYYADFERRIPRVEMEKHETYIKNIVNKIHPNLLVQVMGSFRRGAKDSGDIDILITHKADPEHYASYFDELINTLKTEKYVVDVFAKGNKKFNGVCKLKRHKFNRRIDIMYTRRKEWAFALLYFTGDQAFNISMRKLALDNGMSLNEYGLKYTDDEHKGEHVDANFLSEEDVFAYLGVKYVSPQDRNGRLAFVEE